MLGSVIEAGGAFDGWGSSLLGGALGAVFVLIGVVVAQRLADRRRQEGERRTAAHNLMIRISDLRDAATLSGGSLYGEYDMFPLRNEMLVSYTALGRFPSYGTVSNFYDSVRKLRSHVRGRKRNGGLWTAEEQDVLRTHLDAMYRYSDEVITVLKDHLESARTALAPPALPPLPPQ